MMTRPDDQWVVEELRARLEKRAFMLDCAFAFVVTIGAIVLVWGATTL